MLECIILSTGLHCWPRVCHKGEWSVAVHCLRGVLNTFIQTRLRCTVPYCWNRVYMSNVKLTVPRRNKNRNSTAATYGTLKLELLVIGKSAKSKSVFKCSYVSD